MILDKFTQNVRSQIVDLSKPCRPTLSENVCLTTFSVGLPRTVYSVVCDFIALELVEPDLAFHDDNFCKFHVPYACTSDACAQETRGRFLTERRKKKRKTKPKPRLHYLGNNTSYET